MGESKEDIIQELVQDVRDIKSAFPKDEDGEPDYAGHKVFHKDQVSLEEEAKRRKKTLLSNIFTWLAIGICTLILSKLQIDPELIKLILGK